MSTISTRPITADELLKMGDIGRCELINGEIIHMAPAGWDHGGVALEIGSLMREYVNKNALGKVRGAETGFKIGGNPDTVRAPDVAFVRRERLPASPIRGFFDGPPDLAVEVLSPDNRRSALAAKIKQWLEAGTVSVWVVDPRKKTIAVHRTGDPVLRYEESDEIRDEPMLPGFVLKVGEVFE